MATPLNNSINKQIPLATENDMHEQNSWTPPSLVLQLLISRTKNEFLDYPSLHAIHYFPVNVHLLAV